jgi:hypothetical protein
VPAEVRRLIAEMAAANRIWGEERIAAELLLKLGIRVPPRTVRRYIPIGAPPRDGARSQLWSTFVRNRASATLACDFFVAITLGLDNSVKRASAPPHPSGVGRALQSRASTREPGIGHS